jgi:RNA polymerase sigma factor (sigma-70 family)
MIPPDTEIAELDRERGDAGLSERLPAPEQVLGGHPLSTADFERIYTRRWRGVRRQAWRHLRESERGLGHDEDIAQEVFLDLGRSEAFRLRDRDRGLSAWLQRVSDRRIADYYRRSWSRQTRPADVAGEPDEVVGRLVALDSVKAPDAQDFAIDVRTACDRAQRGLWEDVVFPVFFYGHSYAAVARRSGVPENTLRSRFERARPSLRASLAAYEGGTTGGVPPCNPPSGRSGLQAIVSTIRDHRDPLHLHRSQHRKSTHEVKN